jgi:hypothetical protein
MKYYNLHALLFSAGVSALTKSDESHDHTSINDVFSINKRATQQRKYSDINFEVEGGVEVPTGKYPFMTYVFGCSASLIAPNVLLTAARCEDYFENKEVSIGRTNLSDTNEEYETFTIMEKAIHPNYDAVTLDFDYMVLRLDGNSYHDPVELDDGMFPVTEGENVLAIGWGRTSVGINVSTKLLEVEVNVSNQEQCSTIYQPLYGDASVTDRMLCASRIGTNSCQGDSGSPVIEKLTNKQVGIVSWGENCIDPKYPAVYTKVQDQYDWIMSYVDQWTEFFSDCIDEPNWYNTFGDGCSWYAVDPALRCEALGEDDAGQGPANLKCCVCSDGDSAPPPPNPSPTPAPFVCQDSTDRFDVEFPDGSTRLNKSCEWVKRRLTSYRCTSVIGTKEKCPKTCTNCCRDSTESFTLKANNAIKDCAWAAKNPGVRCSKVPTRLECPVTCRECIFTEL